jgi:hypothetical protein
MPESSPAPAPNPQKPCATGHSGHFDLCHPFGKAADPRQQLTLLSHVPLPNLLKASGLQSAKLAGRDVLCEVQACLYVEHTQQWRLDQLGLGDLVAEISLAPGEERELETYRMERTIVEQSREDVSQFETSREISSLDRESTSVSATASKVNGWRATNSMDLAVGATIPLDVGFDVKADASYKVSSEQSTQLTETTDQRTEHVHEGTVRAAEKLANQTKVQVRTTRETTSSYTDRRTLRNPSPTDSLHLYAYEVNKYFTIATWPSKVAPALRVRLKPLVFDKAFVAENPGFLQGAVADALLATAVPDAHQAASALVVRAADDQALQILERLLFDDVDPDFAAVCPTIPPDTTSAAAVFDLSWPRRQDFDKVRLMFWTGHYARVHQPGSAILKQSAPGAEGGGSSPSVGDKILDLLPAPIAYGYKLIFGDSPPPAKPPTKPSFQDGAVSSRRPDDNAEGDSGLWEWAQTGASAIFLQWRYLFWLWYAAEQKPSSTAGSFWLANRGELLRRYAEQVNTKFEGLSRAVLVDFGESTQLARRLDAFALVAETTFGTPGGLPSRDAETALTGLLAHLNSHAEIYTERYLEWQERLGGSNWRKALIADAIGHADWGDKYNDMNSERGDRWFDHNDVRRVGCDLLVPLREAAPGDVGGKLLRPAFLAMRTLAKGLAVSSSAVQDVLAAAKGAAQEAAPIAERHTGAGESTKQKRSEAKVLISYGVQVLADGVHVVAAGSKC